MSSFKERLKNLFNNSKFKEEPIINFNQDKNLINLIFEQQKKIRNNSKLNSPQNKLLNNNNNTKLEYNNNNYNKSKTKNKTLSRNKSSNNLNKKGIYSNLFTIDKIRNEKTIKNINILMRSFTLKDIHNKFEEINLNKSFSQIDINETERNNFTLKKKIQNMKNVIGLNKENNNRRNINNKPPRNLNFDLCKFNQKEYYCISPNLKNRSFKKKKYINYHFIKDNNLKINNYNFFNRNNNHVSNISNYNNLRKKLKRNLSLIQNELNNF